MKQIFIIIFLFISVIIHGQITGQNDLFGIDSSPAALDTLTNADTVLTRTILFDRPDDMGGSINVGGYIKNLTGDTVSVTPEYSKVRAKHPTRYGPWQAMSAITCAAGTDSIAYELDISGDSPAFCWGYRVRYITSGTHTTKIESVGSHR